MDDKSTPQLDSDGTGAASSHVKRQRVSLACDVCRKKKIKCNGNKPICENCAASNRECKYTPPERKERVRKRPRKTTLSAMDLRLRNIEFTLLELGKIATDKQHKTRRKGGRLPPGGFSKIAAQKEDSSDDSSSTDELDHEEEEEAKSNTSKAGPTDLRTGRESTVQSDLSGRETNITTAAKPEADGLIFGPPPTLTEVPVYFDLQTHKQRLLESNPDLINATLLKTSNTMFLGDNSLFLCGPVGLKWIAEKTGDSTIVPNVTRMMHHFYISGFEAFRSIAMQHNKPDPLPLTLLTLCGNVFKKTMTISTFMSNEELDRLIENEINVPEDLAQRNGLAEKAILHCITALALLLFQGIPETVMTFPFEIDISDVHRQVNSAYYYFFRFSLIGNSIMGVKAGALLLVVSMFNIFHNPTLSISAITVRLAQSHGIHMKQLTAKMPRVEAELLHRLWWTIYFLEKHFTMSFGLPSMIDDDAITTPLPVYNPELEGEIAGTCFTRTQAELLLIWSKISRITSTSTSSSMPMSTTEKLLTLLQLDNELDEWVERLPEKFRPKDNFSHEENLEINDLLEDAWSSQFCILLSHSSFYFIKMTIYRFIAFHPGWVYRVSTDNDTGNESDGLPTSDMRSKFMESSQKDHAEQSWVEGYNGVKLVPRQIAKDNPKLMESFKITLECSRNLIRSATAIDFSPVHLFFIRMLLMNTYITLFIKCLMLPLDSETDSDLELLDKIVAIGRKFRIFTKDFLKSDGNPDLLEFLQSTIQKFVDRKKTEKQQDDLKREQKQQQEQTNGDNNRSNSFSTVNNPAATGGTNPYDAKSIPAVTPPSKLFPGPSEIAQSPMDHTNLTLPPLMPVVNNNQPGAQASGLSPGSQPQPPLNYEPKPEDKDTSFQNSLIENLLFLEDPCVIDSLYQLSTSWDGVQHLDPWSQL